MVSVYRMSVYLCYLARSHAIASLIEFLWFSFINFGTAAGQWCKIRDCPAIFGTVGNYAYQRGRSGAMSKFSSVKEYIQYTKMDKHGTWGTEIELLVLSHLLKTYTYLTTDKKWFVFSPSKLNKKN